MTNLATPTAASIEPVLFQYVPVVFALFLGWLLVFAVAWIFPHSWKRIGLVAGLLWGLGNVVPAIWQDKPGLLGLVAAFWSWGGLPLAVVSQSLGFAPGDAAAILMSLLGGMVLGFVSAWTGNFFRLFL